MQEYIKKVLRQLIWDNGDGRIVRFKTRKGLNMIRDGKRIEVIFITRELPAKLTKPVK